jgi:hypothetical protein
MPKISGGSFRQSFNYSTNKKHTLKHKPKHSPKPYHNKYSPNLYRQTSTTTTMGGTGGALGFGWGYTNVYPVAVIPSEILSINEYDEVIKKEKKNKQKRDKLQRTYQDLK